MLRRLGLTTQRHQGGAQRAGDSRGAVYPKRWCIPQPVVAVNFETISKTARTLAQADFIGLVREQPVVTGVHFVFAPFAVHISSCACSTAELGVVKAFGRIG